MKQLTYLAFVLLLVGLVACKNKTNQTKIDITEPDASALQDSLQPAGLEGSGLTDETSDKFGGQSLEQRKGNVEKPKAPKGKTLKEKVNASKPKTGKSGGGTEEPIAQADENSTTSSSINQVRAITVSEKNLKEENKKSTEATGSLTTETNNSTNASTAADAKEDISHAAWNDLLNKYVTASGTVNYQGLKKEEGKLNSYLETLKNNPPQASWSRNEKLAYWINAYNAFTVKLIVKNYPVNSITDLHNGKPWDVKWIAIGDKTYTLNQIENEIIRPQFNEPRIHFAVNCAAKSCPPLLNAAYTPDKLNSQLQSQTKKFINNSAFNTITANSVTVSKIFDWYKADFDKLIAFLNTYATTDIKANASVNYKEYDWALNN